MLLLYPSQYDRPYHQMQHIPIGFMAQTTCNRALLLMKESKITLHRF